jgi:hypothetical protein
MKARLAIMLVRVLPLVTLLTGCHSGALGAAGISASVSVLSIVNQDWLQAHAPAVLKVSHYTKATPESGASAP